MNIEILHGTSTRLYELVAPLVMSPSVLRQNNNYPFKTSAQHLWFVATENEKVIGFMPAEVKNSCIHLDNYHVSGEDTELLSELTKQVINEFSGEKKPIRVISHAAHARVFSERGFTIQKEWKLYIKMVLE